jgi:hypothetical protein
MRDEIAMLLWVLTERDRNAFVMPGPDPGIHHSWQEPFQKMDCRA